MVQRRLGILELCGCGTRRSRERNSGEGRGRQRGCARRCSPHRRGGGGDPGRGPTGQGCCRRQEQNDEPTNDRNRRASETPTPARPAQNPPERAGPEVRLVGFWRSLFYVELQGHRNRGLRPDTNTLGRFSEAGAVARGAVSASVGRAGREALGAVGGRLSAPPVGARQPRRDPHRRPGHRWAARGDSIVTMSVVHPSRRHWDRCRPMSPAPL